MGKNAHSKITKRLKALRRNHVEEVLIKPRTAELSRKLECSITGLEFRQPAPKNAFLHPKDPEAAFPKHQIQTMVDLRSASIPGSGLEYSGARRKKQQPTLREESDEEGKMVEEKAVPIMKPIGKFHRTKKPCKRSKKIITF